VAGSSEQQPSLDDLTTLAATIVDRIPETD
jgi:hypothetical protein